MTLTVKRLDRKAFEAAANATELGEDARTMARMVLVDGKSMVEVGAKYAMSKQRVFLAVTAVRKAYAENPVGTGWVNMALDIPESVAADLAETLVAIKNTRNKEDARAGTDKLQAGLARVQSFLVKAKRDRDADARQETLL